MQSSVALDDPAAFTPPAPRFAPERVGGIGVLLRVKQNAFSAFPGRCFTEPVVRFPLIGRDLILANSPEAMRHVLASHPELYRRVAAGDRVLGPILGRGLASSEGEAWRRQRRILAPAFTPRTLPVLTRHIMACAEAACTRLEAAGGGPLDLLTTMQELSLDVAATSMFSLETARFGAQLRGLLSVYATSIGRPRASDFLLPRRVPTPTSLRRGLFRRRWTTLIRSIIADRRAATAREAVPRDLFDMLSDAYGTQEESLLADEVSTLIFAGHETTGLTMFWACYLLAHAPEWQAVIRAEAREVDLSPGAAADALAGLSATRAVVEETLRLYPPAYMSARQAAEPHTLCGVPVRKGSLVLLPFCMLQRNPHLWPSPSTFDPRRFLVDAKPDRFAFLPFGAGPRVCIGAQLALSEAVLVLARLVRDNDIRLEPGAPVLPVGSFATRPSRVPVFRLALRAGSRPGGRSARSGAAER